MGGKNPPQHGKLSGYTTMRCRCAPCTRAATLYQNKWRLRSMGTGTAMLPSIGAHRRMRALAAIGWSRATIAAEVGMSASGTVFHQERITQGLHDRIAAVYDRLCLTPGPSEPSRKYAAKQGWPPPMAWDEDTIDDPAAQPDFGAPVRGFDLSEWEFLVECGEDLERAAERCGVSLGSVAKAAYRAGRNDLANRAEVARKRWSAA